MEKIEARFFIKEGTTVNEVMKKGNAQQKKFACVFDANSDGKYTGKEVKLMNATSTKENADGSITFWTNFSSGNKVKNTIAKENLMNETLSISLDLKKETVLIAKRDVMVYYVNDKDYQLIKENPITGVKKYKYDSGYYSCEGLTPEEKKLDLYSYITTDRYGRVLEKSEPIYRAGENGECIEGRVIHKEKLDTYYDINGKKVGTIETLAGGKEKVCDENGKLLFYRVRGNDFNDAIYDKDNKYLGIYSSIKQSELDNFNGSLLEWVKMAN